MAEQQIKSRERVSERGEVFTAVHNGTDPFVL